MMAIFFLNNPNESDMGSRKPLSRSVQRFGDSLGVTLPADVLEQHDITDEDDIAISRYDSDSGEITFSLD